MLCRSCKKNEATVFLKLAVNNKVVEMHLCGTCAPYAAGGELGALDMEPVDIAAMTGDINGYFKEFLPRERKTLHCRSCGLAYHEFKGSGLLGCPDCYSAFGPQLAELLSRMHGDRRHSGKVFRSSGEAVRPRSARRTSARSLTGLEQALKKAVEGEDFETAAILRDRIRRMEG